MASAAPTSAACATLGSRSFHRMVSHASGMSGDSSTPGSPAATTCTAAPKGTYTDPMLAAKMAATASTASPSMIRHHG